MGERLSAERRASLDHALAGYCAQPRGAHRLPRFLQVPLIKDAEGLPPIGAIRHRQSPQGPRAPGDRPDEWTDMNDRKDKNRRANLRSGACELGRVRIISKPGPDAEDRLRRLFALLVRHATSDGQDAPADAPQSEDHAGADA